tara:strand:- start:3633 stop:3806 length:174 start_codon:yes stop_codon:yes gene_type:complete
MSNEKDKKENKKKKYEPPQVRTQKLTAIASLCNGIGGGGRKSSVLPPASCSNNKINS